MNARPLLLALLLAACGGAPAAHRTTEVSMLVRVPCVRPPCTGHREPPPEPPAPTVITGRPAPVMLALGWDHGCALDTEGGVHCWGSNARRQLGDIGERQVPVPSRVPGIPPMSALWAGANQTCARAREDGQLWCWGETGLGPAREPVFAQPLPFDDVRTMGLADRKGCFITGRGALYCWGDYGRPHGPVWDSPQRVPVERATAVHSSMSRSCALTPDGRVTCWGTTPAYTVIERIGHPYYRIPDLRGVVLLALDDFASHPNAWYVDRRGRVLEATPTGRRVQGEGVNHLVTRELPNLDAVVDLRGSSGRYCARTSHGTVACWGINMRGQVGDGTTATRQEPRVLGLTGIEEIATGKLHTCARTETRLYCWGDNEYGQLGVRDLRQALEPVEVPW
jgi:hypothetical protein